MSSDLEPYKVSIATGCYNSEQFIERTFESILAQKYENLEWHIVVDGRTDRTVELLESFRTRAPFPINIIVFESNRGSAIAVPMAVHACSGDFTIIFDHDDELLPDALHGLLRRWDEVAKTNPERAIAAIYGRCINERDEFLGKHVAGNTVSTLGYFQHVIKCRAECASLVRTDVLMRYYNFSPEEIGATNGLIWNRVDRDFDSIFTDLTVRRYHTEISTSQSNQKRIRFPGALANQERESLNDKERYLSIDPIFFLRKIALYLRYSLHANHNAWGAIMDLRSLQMRALAVSLLPMAFWAVRRDLRMGRLG